MSKIRCVAILTGVLLLAVITQSVCAADFSIACRQIANLSRWPDLYKELGLVPDTSWQLQSLNRLVFSERKAGYRFKFAAELSASHYSSDKIAGRSNWQTDRRKTGFKAFKTDSRLLDRSRSQIMSEIERCEISFSSGKFDFQIGRQPISFGTSHYISVMDVLAPFQPGYLDSSYKPGIDAVRIRTISGTTGELELIFAAAADSHDNALFARLRDTFGGFDLEVLAGRFRERKFFGAGWEGEKRKINLWGEVALFERLNQFDHHLGGLSNDYALSWIAGFEKDTGNDWRHGIAFLHQDFGARDVDTLAAAGSTLPYLQGWTHLSASQYVIVNSNRELNPLTHLNMNAMIGLVDKSALLQPVLNISTSDESDLSVFCWIKAGPGPARAGGQVVAGSEFGSFPAGIGAIFRRYF